MRAKINDVIYENISSLNFSPEVSVTMMDLPTDEMSFEIKTEDNVQPNQFVYLQFDNGRQLAKYWIVEATRRNAQIFYIRADSILYLLEKTDLPEREYTSSYSFSTIIGHIFGAIPGLSQSTDYLYYIEGFSGTAWTEGYFPAQTAKDRLQQVCFLAGAIVDTTDIKDVGETQYCCIIRQLNTDVSNIAIHRVYDKPSRDRVGDVKTITVTGRRYTYTPAGNLQPGYEYVNWGSEQYPRWYQVATIKTTITNPNLTVGEAVNAEVQCNVTSSQMTAIADRLRQVYFVTNRKLNAEILEDKAVFGIIKNKVGDYVAIPLEDDTISIGYINSSSWTFGRNIKQRIEMNIVDTKAKAKIKTEIIYNTVPIEEEIVFEELAEDEVDLTDELPYISVFDEEENKISIYAPPDNVVVTAGEEGSTTIEQVEYELWAEYSFDSVYEVYPEGEWDVFVVIPSDESPVRSFYTREEAEEYGESLGVPYEIITTDGFVVWRVIPDDPTIEERVFHTEQEAQAYADTLTVQYTIVQEYWKVQSFKSKEEAEAYAQTVMLGHCTIQSRNAAWMIYEVDDYTNNSGKMDMEFLDAWRDLKGELPHDVPYIEFVNGARLVNRNYLKYLLKRQKIEITRNGEYFPDEEYDCFGEVVAKPEPVLTKRTIKANGYYRPEEDGYEEITVAINKKDWMTDLLITEQGEFEPEEPYKAFAQVKVDIPIENKTELNICERKYSYGNMPYSGVIKTCFVGNHIYEVVLDVVDTGEVDEQGYPIYQMRFDIYRDGSFFQVFDNDDSDDPDKHNLSFIVMGAYSSFEIIGLAGDPYFVFNYPEKVDNGEGYELWQTLPHYVRLEYGGLPAIEHARWYESLFDPFTNYIEWCHGKGWDTHPMYWKIVGPYTYRGERGWAYLTQATHGHTEQGDWMAEKDGIALIFAGVTGIQFLGYVYEREFDVVHYYEPDIADFKKPCVINGRELLFMFYDPLLTEEQGLSANIQFRRVSYSADRPELKAIISPPPIAEQSRFESACRVSTNICVGANTYWLIAISDVDNLGDRWPNYCPHLYELVNDEWVDRGKYYLNGNTTGIGFGAIKKEDFAVMSSVPIAQPFITPDSEWEELQTYENYNNLDGVYRIRKEVK